MLVTCKTCGAVSVVDSSTQGMNVHCSSCGTVFKCTEDGCEMHDSMDTLECEVCGLKCQTGLDKCPACGGKLISIESSAQPQNSIADEDTTNGSTSTDVFLENWEKHLGGHSFSVVIGLASTIIWAVFVNLSIFREKFFGFTSAKLLWWVMVFEIASNAVLGLIALALLVLFFRRSRFLFKGLPAYFKLCGIFLLLDLMLIILAAEVESYQIVDIKEFRAAMGCFFWSWYFKRIFMPSKSTGSRANLP